VAVLRLRGAERDEVKTAKLKITAIKEVSEQVSARHSRLFCSHCSFLKMAVLVDKTGNIVATHAITLHGQYE